MTAMVSDVTALVLIGLLVVLGVLVGLGLVLLASLRERHVIRGRGGERRATNRDRAA